MVTHLTRSLENLHQSSVVKAEHSLQSFKSGQEQAHKIYPNDQPKARQANKLNHQQLNPLGLVETQQQLQKSCSQQTLSSRWETSTLPRRQSALIEFEGNELPSEIRFEDQLSRQNSLVAPAGVGLAAHQGIVVGHSSSPGFGLGLNGNDIGLRNHGIGL